MRTAIVWLLIPPVRACRLNLSPWLGHAFRFQPSCSVHTIEAPEPHGPLWGPWLTLHRLGRETNLFHLEEVAPGSVFWHRRGWRLLRALIGYMRISQEAAGYVELDSPDIMDRGLWETSGHWQNYRNHMHQTRAKGAREAEAQTVTIRRHGAAETQTLSLSEAVTLLPRDAGAPIRT